jgi:hypothetical protein
MTSICRIALKCGIYLVDGIAGSEAQNAEKRLATHVVDKWTHEYSQIVLCEVQDGNPIGPSKQPPYSWQPGSTETLAPPHPQQQQGCLRQLADLAGQVMALGTSPFCSSPPHGILN